MATSEFWRNIAAEFRALDPDAMLYGSWDCLVTGGMPCQWTLRGHTRAVQIRFEALARRAASEMPQPEFSDSLLSWLEAVRKNGHQLGSSYYTDTGADGAKLDHVTGNVHNLCQESASLCSMFESHLLQTEFEEKLRNDPKNWSQLHQAIEARKAIQKVHATPPEQIPESFVREVLGRQYNTSPDQVPDAVIRFEVSGLLPFYPHIQVVPSESTPPETPQGVIEQSVTTEQQPVQPSLVSQLQRLRDECRWSIEQLADAVSMNPRTVARHLSGDSVPHPRNIAAYERAFSKQLKKQIVLR